ncbi:signal transduction histidine kinase CheA [Desulfocucumis palustris]|uniref:Chemotaxis protein CheA n=1 Tax=Desulfocucumis palustris TaxID=1898651 RepID=A0A2L2XLD3_9FIRM|nr:chemotaxis protein CheA [Desulfocucumis palustris]GBF35106.1 signal transduction histidine kinase CheA [Desulfocucumis palustris]
MTGDNNGKHTPDNDSIAENLTLINEDNPAGVTENEAASQEYRPVVTPEMVNIFINEAMELFEEAETALLELEKSPEDREYIEQVFRVFHSFKGNAGFLGYRDYEKLSHKAESIFEDIRKGRSLVNEETVSVLLSVIDVMRDGTRNLKPGETADLPGKDILIDLLDNLEIFSQLLPEMTEQPPVDTPAGVTVTCTVKEEEDFFYQNGQCRDNHGEETPCPPPLEKPEGKERCKDPEHDAGSPENNKKQSTIQRAIRVDVEKLDSLLDLVGELVIAEAMVSHNPDIQGLQLDRLDKSLLQLTKITREIQDMAMSMRMIPLAGTFQKMTRLVRDLSLKVNKRIKLVISGEETEVDKTIIEQISDPLVHLIRNAADHGIEAPEERMAAGKPETGHITLEARHSAGEVLIIVKDDGRGLNRQKILKKAGKLGLLQDEAKDLKDEEVWNLIFEPGFSTADNVSSISGRGVGMDVVKSQIGKLRGRVDIRSTPGQGTIFSIRIPLTMAIIEGMVVRVGKAGYTIPIISIKESLQPRPEQITVTPGGLELITIRGEILPVIRLHELYKIKPTYKNLTEGIVIVVESDAKKCCLFVDELAGHQQIVIKALSGYFGKVRGISGFAILGEGEVSMILDITSLVNSAESLLENSTAKHAV